MSFPDRDRRQAIQEPAHDLKACLRRCICAARNDDGPIAWAIREASGSNPLSEATDEADGSSGTEHRPVVVIHLVSQARIADLIESQKLIETLRAAIGHQESMKRHGEPRFAQCLNGSGFSENACAGRNQNVLTAVRVHGVRDEAIDWRGSAAIEPVGQNRVDDGSLEERMERPGRADCLRTLWGSPLRVRRVGLAAGG
jgi:hypothetical protein